MTALDVFFNTEEFDGLAIVVMSEQDVNIVTSFRSRISTDNVSAGLIALLKSYGVNINTPINS